MADQEKQTVNPKTVNQKASTQLLAYLQFPQRNELTSERKSSNRLEVQQLQTSHLRSTILSTIVDGHWTYFLIT